MTVLVRGVLAIDGRSIATRTDQSSTALPPIVLANRAQAEMVEICDHRNLAVSSGEPVECRPPDL
jgi:hypothetical protein